MLAGQIVMRCASAENLIVILLMVLATGCKKYEPAPAAFHLRAESIQVEPPTGLTSAPHNISDFWLYVNNQFQGCYPVSATMPIISNHKSARIHLFAGIRNNGISSTRIPWAMYDVVQFDTLAAAGSTVSIPVSFRYNSATTFTWTENFDHGIGVSVTRSQQSDTTFAFASTEDSFEGRSLELGIQAPGMVAQIESAGTGFYLPGGNSNVYLELNYKCDHEFTVGLMGEDRQLRPAMNINPQQEWNKIYIQLADVVNTPQVSPRYRVYFRMLRSESQSSAKLFLDNIRLVYL